MVWGSKFLKIPLVKHSKTKAALVSNSPGVQKSLNMPILVVDDDKGFAQLLKIRLQANGGYEVCLAHSAQAAFERLGVPDTKTSTDIDLILMDVNLPDLGGIEACRRIKSHPLRQDIPIIIITGYDDLDRLEAAFDAGAADYIAKPFDSVNLMVRIRSALDLKREADIRKQREQELLELTHQLETINEQLRQLSSLDGLTGVANRRQFDNTIRQEFQRARRNQTSLSVIMIDIDSFKAYNDIYRHQAGDDCLRQVSAALGLVLKRPNDLLARYGGEEFAVILPDTDEEGARILAESLRQAVESLKIPHRLASRNISVITISLGVATRMPHRDDDYCSLIASADDALYQSKRAGRNCVTVADL